jgi:ribosomal protein L37AE/L43A
MNETSDTDARPNCGEHVESMSAYGIGARREGQPLPEATQQTRECPACGKLLRRPVGGSWQVDETAD